MRNVHYGTDEVPLPAANVAGTRYKRNPLVEVTKLDAKPTVALSAHVRGNDSAGNFTPIGMRPHNPASAYARAALQHFNLRKLVRPNLLEKSIIGFLRYLYAPDNLSSFRSASIAEMILTSGCALQ
jgi:hypothetical protein